MAEKRILIAEDEPKLRRLISLLLEREDYALTTVADGQEALDALKAESFDLLITDLKMPRVDGRELLVQARQDYPDLPVIVITAFGSIESAVETLQAGAIDYITKPFDEERLKISVERGLRFHQLMAENTALRREVKSRWDLENIVTRSTQMKFAIDMARRVAQSNANVIVYGESGTGKELITRGIHHASPRATEPFVAINCAAIPDELLESELFGHEKGAFTGAVATKPGKFELADGGTLFLDEIGDLSFHVQAKVLRAIENREIQHVGGTELHHVDVRFIAATNKNLEEEVQAGRFREDLFFRLNVFPIYLPPLRERPADIIPLTEYFLSRFCAQMGKRVPPLGEDVRQQLCKHPWPGNVRELQNTVERAVILLQGDTLDADNLLQATGRSLRPLDASEEHSPYALELPDSGFSLEALEKALIEQALKRCNYKKAPAARMLGLTRATLRYRLEKYNLSGEDASNAAKDQDA